MKEAAYWFKQSKRGADWLRLKLPSILWQRFVSSLIKWEIHASAKCLKSRRELCPKIFL